MWNGGKKGRFLIRHEKGTPAELIQQFFQGGEVGRCSLDRLHPALRRLQLREANLKKAVYEHRLGNGVQSTLEIGGGGMGKESDLGVSSKGK